MQIKLYNTMSRKIEEFKPLIPGQVSFYSCGPTVYHYAHIGNLRQFILADLLKRMFLANDYKPNRSIFANSPIAIDFHQFQMF